MRLAPIALAVALTAPPLHAQDLAPPPLPDTSERDGSDRIEDGARMLLRGLIDEVEPGLRDLQGKLDDMKPALRDLMAVIGDIDDYQAPEVLENGDILIRRRPHGQDVSPPPDAMPPQDAPVPGPVTGQIDI